MAISKHNIRAACLMLVAVTIWGCSGKDAGERNAVESTSPSFSPTYTNPSPVVESSVCITPEYDNAATEAPKPADNVQISNSPYDEGYEEGFDEGISDASDHRRFGYNFDDCNEYSGNASKQYCLGYADGYEDGYNSGCTDDEEENEKED